MGNGSANGYGGNIFGGFILGCGMSISGACPGTAIVQLGSGSVPMAVYTVAGALVGALGVGYLHAAVTQFQKNFLKIKTSAFVDKLLNMSVVTTSLAFAAMLSAFIYGLETFFPWRQDAIRLIAGYNPRVDGANSLNIFAKIWSPIMSGIVVGICQIPSYLLIGSPVGTSSSYVTAVAHVVMLLDSKLKTTPYFRNFVRSFDFYQVTKKKKKSKNGTSFKEKRHVEMWSMQASTL